MSSQATGCGASLELGLTRASAHITMEQGRDGRAAHGRSRRLSSMGKVSVRYIVSDVDAAIPFYTEMLGFHVDMHPSPGFARLSKGDLQLLLSRPGAGGAGQAMPDGQGPVPGGWNRIQIEVDNL